MPGIYLSDPPATETETDKTGSKTAASQEAPAVTGGAVTLPNSFEVGPETCGFTSGSTSTLSSNLTVLFLFLLGLPISSQTKPITPPHILTTSPAPIEPTYLPGPNTQGKGWLKRARWLQYSAR